MQTSSLQPKAKGLTCLKRFISSRSDHLLLTIFWTCNGTWIKWKTYFRIFLISDFSPQLSLLPAALCCTEASGQLIGQCERLSSPDKMCGLSWLAALWRVNEERTELDGQSRPDQADPPGDLRAGVIDPAAGGMHEQRIRSEKHGEHLRAAAVRQHLLFSGEPLGARGALQPVGEDHGSVVTAQEVPLSAAQRQEGEVLVTPALIGAQAAEEENQEVFVWKNKRTPTVNNQRRVC